MALRCGFKGEMGGKRHYYHVLHLIVNFPLECIQLTLTVSAYTDVHSMMMFCAKWPMAYTYSFIAKLKPMKYIKKYWPDVWNYFW